MLVEPDKKKLVFVSPRFLLPLDSGGRIRTCQILKGLKSLGRYHIALLSPATDAEQQAHGAALRDYCDEFSAWRSPTRIAYLARRFLGMFSSIPMPVAVDRTRAALRAVEQAVAKGADVVVFDFLHGSVLRPAGCEIPTVLFTHNVEAEIFERHLAVSGNWMMKLVWRNQLRKMLELESRQLKAFNVVVAVSARDSQQFANRYQLANCHVIPTGVDLTQYPYRGPCDEPTVVFCGSMDWLANQDGVTWVMDHVWSLVTARVPNARMRVIGRNPPGRLVERGRGIGGWSFSGFVEDVREHLLEGAVSIIPLRVGGGTRMKAFESMALGVPVVSTRLGVEGLNLVPGEHFLQADTAEAFADAMVELLIDASLRQRVSIAARQLVEHSASHLAAARAFQSACEEAERC